MDILIFDMDGVLIDVTQSYRKTIQKTIHIYLEQCLGLKANRVSPEDISLFKSAGGFNNDWDLTSGFLLYLLSTSKVPPLPVKKFSSLDKIVLHLRQQLTGFRQRRPVSLKRNHLSSFLEQVRISGGGLKGIRSVLDRCWDGWIYRSGNLAKENLIKRIFQEIYLGEKFSSLYHLPCLFYHGKGLFLREKLLIERNVLASLRRKMRLGIASGRPKFEAELALKRFRIFPYFDSVVTLDECEQEEAKIFKETRRKIRLSKPHPFSILKAIEEIGIPNPQCGYVGDVVDDVLAAQRAKKKVRMLAIGFAVDGGNKKRAREILLKAGADYVIENPQQLLDLAV